MARAELRCDECGGDPVRDDHTACGAKSLRRAFYARGMLIRRRHEAKLMEIITGEPHPWPPKGEDKK
jgi:hypothetical protein